MNVIYLQIDSDVTTEDESERQIQSESTPGVQPEVCCSQSECTSESNAEPIFEFDSKSDTESESTDDGLTTCFQDRLPDIRTAHKWPKEESSVKPKKDKIDTNAVANRVLSFFQACNINPENLTDEQVEKYIKYIVKNQSNVKYQAKSTTNFSGSYF